MSPDCATAEVLGSADPFRPFRSYRGQRHYPGLYYSATERRHVGYESLLEGACAMLADFAPEIRRCVSQPFQIWTRVGAKLCNHYPDYLLVRESGLTVVAVKSTTELTDPEILATFAWVRRAVESAGWTFEVFSEPNPVALANVRFFAGFRRVENVCADLLGELRAHDLIGRTFADAQQLVDGPMLRVRAALLHMLWRQEIQIDLGQPLLMSTILMPGARS